MASSSASSASTVAVGGGGGGGGGGKLTPNLDQQGTKLLNLTVLQRVDPNIEEILITAAHVTLYEFNVELNQWSRKDVEGSLFVVKRNSQPRFQFIVMNRRSTENLVEDLLGNFEYEVQVPYLLYRNASQEVNGIWFYTPRECEEVANLFSRILCAYSKVSPKIQVAPGKSSEFEELEAIPTSAAFEGPLEPCAASARGHVPEETSFVNFFSTAKSIGHGPSSIVKSEQHYQPPSSTVPLPSHVLGAVPSLAALQVPSLPMGTPSTPPLSMHGTSEPISNSNRITNLVKPSSFTSSPSLSAFLMPAISSSTPNQWSPTAILRPPLTLQRPQGSSLLQPFTPPAPPPSLTSYTSAASNQGSLDREKVRNALLMLVQDDQFINLFCQALAKAHK